MKTIKIIGLLVLFITSVFLILSFTKKNKKETENIKQTVIQRNNNVQNDRISITHHRVQLHTQFPTNAINNKLFFALEDTLVNMGVKSYTRFIKGDGKGAWWPSSVGEMDAKLKGVNIANTIIENAHRNNLNIIAYHRHMEDEWVLENHPTWATRDWTGKVYMHRGPRICWNSPYRQFVATRMEELVKMGVDGLYFDSVQMPRDACFCDNCKKAFKEQYGETKFPNKPNLNDPSYLKLIALNNKTVTDSFREWTTKLKSINPKVALVMGNHHWPTLLDYHLNEEYIAISDIPKTEFNAGASKSKEMLFLKPDNHLVQDDIKMMMGWDLVYCLSGEKPPHVWIPHILDNYENPEMIKLAASAIIVNGGIANFHFSLENLTRKDLKPVFQFGDQAGKVLKDSKRVKWIALHYDETLRTSLFTDSVGYFRDFYYPFHGLYKYLKSQNIPFTILSTDQIAAEGLSEYSILVSLAGSAENPKLKTPIQQFKKDGKTVIVPETGLKWEDRNEFQAISKKLTAQLKTLGEPILWAENTSDKMIIKFYENDSKFIVTASNRIDKLETKEVKKQPSTPEIPAMAEFTLCLNKDVFKTIPIVKDSFTGKNYTVKDTGNRFEVTIDPFFAGTFIEIAKK